MKRYSNEEIDKLLKEKSDQYLLYPSDRIWKNIHKELHPRYGWRYIPIAILLLFIASISIHVKKEEIAKSIVLDKKNVYQYIEIPSVSLENNTLLLPTIYIPGQKQKNEHDLYLKPSVSDRLITLSRIEKKREIDFPVRISISPSFYTIQPNEPDKSNSQKEEKKQSISETIDLVLNAAKKISKDISWQFYGGPNMGYRRLKGVASRNFFQYSLYSLSTNAAFARDVKDVVNHKPALGFELGTAMFYPLGKKINFKAGIQANYNQYQIKAFSTIPEIATYSVNSNSPETALLNAVSIYRNSQGLSPATIQNEHYMISLPVGLEYRISGTNRLNFSVGSTIQPTYVFANYSYLLSSNLQNYAKEPSLNRTWNINSAVEASVNFENNGYRWSIAPQFRYQLLSSFKDKYPLKENLMDMGIKVGIIKTIN
jgi:hypothetical protein